MDDTKQIVTTTDSLPTRAKSFKVKVGSPDYPQYANTIKAYALAGMPFEHIANAGDYLGDEVERLELDAAIAEGWKRKAGEIAEDPTGKIMAWQTRGETISLSHQIAQLPVITGMEVVKSSEELAISGQNEEKKLDVVEGIAVVKDDPTQLQNNIYLSAPADLTKK